MLLAPIALLVFLVSSNSSGSCSTLLALKNLLAKLFFTAGFKPAPMSRFIESSLFSSVPSSSCSGNISIALLSVGASVVIETSTFLFLDYLSRFFAKNIPVSLDSVLSISFL